MRLKPFIVWGSIIFFCFPLEWNMGRGALSQKPTLDRMLASPTSQIQKLLNRVSCSNKSARAALQAFEDSDDPDSCTCDGPFDTQADAWNGCISCFFMSLVGIYNTLVSTFSEVIDPDLNINSTILIEENELNVISQASSLDEYDRRTTFSDGDGNLCLSIYYSKHEVDSSRAKGLFHMNTAYCPGLGGDGASYAMAMEFDTRYTDADIQTAELMTAIRVSDAFDLTAGDDQLFYTRLNVNDDGDPITTAHSYLLGANVAWKFFVHGIDDDLLLVGSNPAGDFTDVVVDGSDLITECTNDADNSDAGAACDTAGYELSDYSFTVNSISTAIFPTWSLESLEVSSDSGIEQYFIP